MTLTDKTSVHYALSDSDINHILEPDTKVQQYRVLDNMHHIDELFDKLGRAVLLYSTDSPTSGHWVGLIKKGTPLNSLTLTVSSLTHNNTSWVKGLTM